LNLAATSQLRGTEGEQCCCERGAFVFFRCVEDDFTDLVEVQQHLVRDWSGAVRLRLCIRRYPGDKSGCTRTFPVNNVTWLTEISAVTSCLVISANVKPSETNIRSALTSASPANESITA